MKPAKKENFPVLCVEDDSVSRALLARILRPNFSNVLMAKDGVEGLDLFHRHRPPLVITDIQMPNLDGIRMAQVIKEECPETMIIITTSRGDAEMLLSAIEVGVFDYVIKPLAPSRLYAAIDKCLKVKAMERELRQSKERTEAILESIGDAFFVLDGLGRMTYLNKKAEAFFGLSRDSLPEQPFSSLFPEFRSSWEHFLEASTARENRSFEHFTPTLGLCHEVQIYPFADGVSVYLRDITERKASEEKISSLVFYDKLTGLPNRSLLQERLTRSVARLRRTGGKCALLLLDLDHFKHVNDSLGHEAGDLVLKEVATRLQSCIRESDTAARQGGDEFILLLDNLESTEHVHAIAHRLMQVISREIVHEDMPLSVSASIGICFFPGDGDTAEQLLKAADSAMYHGKHRGRNTYQFYRKEMNNRASKFMQPGRRAPGGGEEQGIPAQLPAPARPENPRAGRVRSAGALAPSAAGHHSAQRFHPAGGGHGLHPAHRRMGPGRGLQAGAPVAGSADRTFRDGGQPVPPPVLAGGPGGHRQADPRAQPGPRQVP